MAKKTTISPQTRTGPSLTKALDQDHAPQLADQNPDPKSDAKEFIRLSHLAKGNSRGSKFHRDEAHQRR